MRRQNRSPGRSDSLPASIDPGGPVVLLQLESFFDARRLGSFVPSDLLPNYDRCVAGSIANGRMEAPAFGANTVRTEFAALTGLPASELGLDRFNPYAAYARVPIDSIAWRLRAAGFRTVCIHPFAGRFYGRRRVIPNLGFDQFLDIGAFAGYDRGPTYMSDVTVVREIERVLAESGPRTFIFAITMGNHSPWQRPTLGAMPDLPQGEAFARFLAGLAETDVAIGAMAELMRRKWRSGLFAAFGDHLPSFPDLFCHLGHVSRATDYVMWQAGRAFGDHRDIMAHHLPGLLLRAAESSQASRSAPIARLQS
jgi:phosphoglycerol transferase MdoB-like AlkP superfamily enzyme